jgi:hypothetical protein
VPLDDVQVFHEHAPLAGLRFDHVPLLAAILARQHLDEIALADLHAVFPPSSGKRLGKTLLIFTLVLLMGFL